ncbi:transglycosylase SLT domain-containing protein [Kitasatospora sp. MBT63]|uniref:transglycosylase SLT domain-containing protein n=1 Tax=Kitasatospora sp. MBT63 TaxID=1444768 RepID=UPI0006923F6A|nr:transglycosylase SLT domain-containing protein [Kitasatospora sp. MBT63]
MTATGPRKAALCLISVTIAAVPLAGCAKKADGTATAAAAAATAARPSPEDSATLSPSAQPTASDAPTTGASPSPSASATASPSAKRTSASPSPAKTAAKPVAAAPPPTAKPGPVAPPPPPATPHTPPLQSGCAPSHTGTDAPRATVGDALAAAAGQSRTLALGSGGTDKLPPLPVALVKAISWQESGWQSTILACDGGIGTMQIMPNTVSWMNTKFGTKSDVNTLNGNVQLGAQLIDWLVAYYGDSCFGGNYDLSPDPVTGKTPLLDLVIAAYNAGAGNVHYNTTTDPATGATVGTSVIPNPSYVANVKAIMAKSPWTAAG